MSKNEIFSTIRIAGWISCCELKNFKSNICIFICCSFDNLYLAFRNMFIYFCIMANITKYIDLHLKVHDMDSEIAWFLLAYECWNTIYVAQGHYNLRFFGRIRIDLSIKYLGAFHRETSVKLAMRILLQCNRVSIAPRGEIWNCIIYLLHKQEIAAIWSSKVASQSS